MADLLTLHEHAHLFSGASPGSSRGTTSEGLSALPPLTIAWVGDSSNVLHDMLVTYPRLGHKLRVGTPSNPKYHAPAAVWDKIKVVECEKVSSGRTIPGKLSMVPTSWSPTPGSTWVNQRLKDFNGFQVTEKLWKEGAANPNWKFLHCLPRKEHEVDDEVFHGPRSLVFPKKLRIGSGRSWHCLINFSVSGSCEDFS